MLAELEKGFAAIEAQKADVLARVGALTQAQRTARPSANDWSPQGIVEHLLLYEELVGKWVAAADGAPRGKKRRRLPPSPFVPLMSAVMRLGVRVPTLPELLPQNEASFEALEGRWAASRAALRERLEAATPETRSSPIALHPIAGPLGAAEMLRLADAHLAYHQRQLARLASRRRAA